MELMVAFFLGGGVIFGCHSISTFRKRQKRDLNIFSIRNLISLSYQWMLVTAEGFKSLFCPVVGLTPVVWERLKSQTLVNFLSSEGFCSQVIVCTVAINKALQPMWLKQQMFISLSLGGWKSRTSCQQVWFWWGLFSLAGRWLPLSGCASVSSSNETPGCWVGACSQIQSPQGPIPDTWGLGLLSVNLGRSSVCNSKNRLHAYLCKGIFFSHLTRCAIAASWEHSGALLFVAGGCLYLMV